MHWPPVEAPPPSYYFPHAKRWRSNSHEMHECRPVPYENRRYSDDQTILRRPPSRHDSPDIVRPDIPLSTDEYLGRPPSREDGTVLRRPPSRHDTPEGAPCSEIVDKNVVDYVKVLEKNVRNPAAPFASNKQINKGSSGCLKRPSSSSVQSSGITTSKENPPRKKSKSSVEKSTAELEEGELPDTSIDSIESDSSSSVCSSDPPEDDDADDEGIKKVKQRLKLLLNEAKTIKEQLKSKATKRKERRKQRKRKTENSPEAKMEASSSSGVPLSPTPPTSSTDPGPGGDGESSSYAIIRSVSVESGQQEVGPSDPQPPGSDDKKIFKYAVI